MKPGEVFRKSVARIKERKQNPFLALGPIGDKFESVVQIDEARMIKYLTTIRGQAFHHHLYTPTPKGMIIRGGLSELLTSVGFSYAPLERSNLVRTQNPDLKISNEGIGIGGLPLDPSQPALRARRNMGQGNQVESIDLLFGHNLSQIENRKVGYTLAQIDLTDQYGTENKELIDSIARGYLQALGFKVEQKQISNPFQLMVLDSKELLHHKDALTQAIYGER
jgi:hypothetical protein